MTRLAHHIIYLLVASVVLVIFLGFCAEAVWHAVRYKQPTRKTT
jgi:uncharacterized membrane protein